MNRYFYIFLGTTFLLFQFGWCQQNQKLLYASLSEKIYLQLDGNVYTNNQTVWFKAIVTNATDHKPTSLSGVLYVELISPDEKITRKKLVKIENGIGDGFFQLHESDMTGRYLIRAYTQWNQNFGEALIFKEYIKIYPSSSKEEENPITNIALVEKQPGKFWFNATLNPFAVDSLHEKKLKVYITLDGKKDSLSIKRNRDEKYSIDYPVPADGQLITLNMTTNNLINYSKTIALDQDLIDFQFFPESGALVDGLPGKVAFKVLDLSGNGKKVTGDIVDEGGRVITSFKSNALGMGVFAITANSDVDYYAKLASKSDEGLSLKYPLPKAVPEGNILSVRKAQDKIHLTASSNYLVNDSVYIHVRSRGLKQYLIKGTLKEGEIGFFISAIQLPDGIIEFTLMDSKQPLAQRLYFNERLSERLDIEISTKKNSYVQREKTTLDISIADDQNKAVSANLSVLVINKEQLGLVQNMRQNILTYLLMDSELKGNIEKPGYYFREENTTRYQDLDALMLTQGWRGYLYNNISGDTLLTPPEYMLNLSGSVKTSFSGKRKKREVELTMMTFNEPRLIQSQTTNDFGRFHFNINDQYGPDLNVVIQSANKAGKKKDYTILLDKKIMPSISFDQKKSIDKVNSMFNFIVDKNQERKMVDDAFRLSEGITYLDEVVIEEYQITPEREKVLKRLGKPDVVIDGDAIREKEEEWSYGLYSVLLFSFPNDIAIRRVGGPGGFLYAKVLGGFGPTLVVIDGIPVLNYNYHLIPGIPPSEVKSVEIIRGAKDFLNLFLEVVPDADPFSAPGAGDVISIYTHAGKGLRGSRSPKGLIQTSVPVFSPRREFYKPKYEKLLPKDWVKPDLRALLHWEPTIKTDSQGRASTSYYNADNIGETVVVVEAISDDGKIGYKEIEYIVDKRDR